MLRSHALLRTLGLASVLASAAPMLFSLGAQRLLASAHHTQWSESEGLPSAVMDRVVRSGDGYLWLGGEGPLVRFDGVHFTTFDGTNTPALAAGALAGARPRIVDRDGTMWISRRDGALVQYRDGEFRVVVKPNINKQYIGFVARDGTGKLWALNSRTWELCVVDGDSLFPVPLPPGISRTEPRGIVSDASDGVLVGTRSKGIVHITPRGAVVYPRPPSKADGATRPLLQSQDGTVWAFHEGLQMYRNGSWTRLTMPATGAQITPTAAAESSDGAVWVATRGQGVLRFLNGRIEQFSEHEGLSNAVAADVTVDEEGNVWVVTETSLDRLRRAPFSLLGPSQGLQFASSRWIAPDVGGAIWTWSLPGPRLYRIDGGIVRGQPGPVTATPVRDTASVRYLPMSTARAGGLWAYDDAIRGISRITPTSETPAGVRAELLPIRAFETRRGDLWVSAADRKLGWVSGQGWQNADVPNESDSTLIGEIGEDASGRALIVQDRDPILVVMDSGKVVRRLGSAQGLHGLVIHVVADGVDTLWLNDTDSTLYRVIGDKVTVLRTPALTSLLQTRSSALVPAGDKFFIASTSGITSVSRAALHAAADGRAPFPAIRRYSALDGASSSRLTVLNASPAFRAIDGRIWFSTPEGLLVYDARDDIPNTVAPRVHIEEVRAVDSVLDRASIVRVPAGAERVQFRFTVTALRVPERARLEFKLDGVDANWRTADATRTVTYTQLRPHQYTFRVRGWNEDGVPAAQEGLLRIRVMPLWYQSWWFLSLAVLSAIAATAGIVALALRARQRVVASRLAAGFEATLAERTRLAGELHDTLLQAFTGVTLQLQALRSRIIDAPQEVERDIGRVLTVADGALREARSAVWDMRAPELEGGDVAAALEQSARAAVDAHVFAGGAPVELVVTVSGRRRRVAPTIETAAHRIGREAVGNALRHASAKQIRLTIDFEPHHLCLEVRDNGLGFDASAVVPTEGRGRWGLVGMRERATSAGGSFDVASVPGSGTVLVLRLPLAQP